MRLHAVGRVAVEPGETALVIGAGVIGLLVLQALKMHGCGRVFVSDLSEARLEVARRTGADETFVANRPTWRQQMLATAPAAKAVDVDHGMRWILAGPERRHRSTVRKGGRVGLVGNLQATCDFPLQKVVTREI